MSWREQLENALRPGQVSRDGDTVVPAAALRDALAFIEAREAARSDAPLWRVGRSVGRTLYEIGDRCCDDPECGGNDRLIGLMDTKELAARVVAAVNARPEDRVVISDSGVARYSTDGSRETLVGQAPADIRDEIVRLAVAWRWQWQHGSGNAAAIQLTDAVDRLSAAPADDTAAPICRACGRPFSPTHDADAPGPTVRHLFMPAVDTTPGANGEPS